MPPCYLFKYCIRLCYTRKKSRPNCCWDRTGYPAVPPGLVHMYPLTAYHHTPAFDHGAPSPSHILGLFESFLFALRSPFNGTVPAAISPSAALSKAGDTAYSLSFNGLAQCSTAVRKMQEFFIPMRILICFFYCVREIQESCRGQSRNEGRTDFIRCMPAYGGGII